MSWEDREWAGGGSLYRGRGFADNPLNWAPTIGRVAGIRIRIHILFILYILFELLKAGAYFSYQAHGLFILFTSVFLHELGHCFAARRVGGKAEEVLMWPLGGLATVDVPRRPGPEFITVICGPLVNVVLFLCAALVLRFDVPWNPFDTSSRLAASWGNPRAWASLIYQYNMMLFLFNLLPMYPLDGGQMFKCGVWWLKGLAKATLIAATLGMVIAVVLGLYALVQAQYLLVTIAIMGYMTCYQERLRVRANGIAQDGYMGYDFSGGYSTLEKDKKRKPGWLARWRQNRTATRARRQAAMQESIQIEVDRILEKVHREGINSLSTREKRTLEEASRLEKSADKRWKVHPLQGDFRPSDKNRP